MTDLPSVVVIGAGAAGLSTALCLAERGCRDVTVIDREHVAAGSSSLSVGIYTRQYIDPFDIALRIETTERLFQLERENGMTIRRNGYLRLAHDDATMAGFEQAAQTQRELGVEDARALSAQELAQLIPDMRCDDLAGGLLGPSDGYLDGQQLCMTYAERAEALGVRILGRHGLVGAERLADGRHRLLTERGGPLDCDVVVNAAGSWAPAVGALLGAAVEILPERHQACIMRLARPLAYELPSVMDYVPGSGQLGLYVRPEGEHQLVVGLHTNDRVAGVSDPEQFHRGADADFVDALIPLLVERMPGFADVGFEGGWAGLYPNSADDRFVIGPSPEVAGAFEVGGLSGLGIYMSPVAGRIAADWILDGRPRSQQEREAFAPARFAARADAVADGAAGADAHLSPNARRDYGRAAN